MNIARLFHTVRYLKPVQIYGRLWFKLYRPKIRIQPPAIERTIVGEWTQPCKRKQSLITPYRFRFLNVEHDCKFPKDWNNPRWDKLWLYNLHYFDDLQAKGAGNRKDLHAELIEKWIQGNPPDHGNGWESYPISLRIVNWIKWALARNRPSPGMLQSLAIQVRYLQKRLEFHLLGNHLFTNAKALLFAGLYFMGDEAEYWLNRGLKIVDRQLAEQVLPDGGHFEHSPMYHAIILEDLLDLINVMQTYGQETNPYWRDSAEKMLDWLAAMQHPDGEIVLFNDAAFKIASSPKELVAYAGRLGLHCTRNSLGRATHLRESGYIRVNQGPVSAFLDVAPIGPDYLPGHAHADTLNFEFSLFDQRIIVDSGTSTYTAGPERVSNRETAAHNTVTIDKCDSSEVWGSFRVARRAQPFDLSISKENGKIRVACSHDGYRRLSGKPTHRREWLFENDRMVIRDRISGHFKNAIARFYFHPEVKLIPNLDLTAGEIQLRTGANMNWKVKAGSPGLADKNYHPEFGLSKPNKCLEAKFEGRQVVVEFRWNSKT